VWKTIAHNLAVHNPSICSYLDSFLAGNPTYLETKQFTEHLGDLVIDPLRQILNQSSGEIPIILLDALDECQDADIKGENQRSELLESLKQWFTLPSQFKMIVTGREEVDIINVLLPQSRQLKLLTGDQVQENSTTDIRLFLQQSFSRMNVTEQGPWPAAEKINFLAEHAAGLFIWAKTAVDFIAQKRGSPQHRLEIICESIHSPKSWDNQDSRIDHLYGQILYSIFRPLTKDERKTYQAVLGTLLSLKNLLSLQGLHELLSFLFDTAAIRAFQCVLVEVENDRALCLHYKSFYDFCKYGPQGSLEAIQSLQRESKREQEISRVNVFNEAAH
jgi:hypothetical protein